MKPLPRIGPRILPRIWGCALACLLAPLTLQAQVGPAPFNINTVSPTTLAAGVNGATLAISGTLPESTFYGYCFYTGYGGNNPIAPTSFGSSQTVVVPASRIQQIPPSSFTGGAFTAKLYVQIADSTCNGTYNASITNEQNVTILLPIVNSVYATNLQELNSTLGIQPPPYTLTFAGAEYLSTSNVTFTWASGSSATGTAHLASSNSLVTTVPSTIPAGISSVTATLCNQTSSYSYCAPAQSINVTQLNASAGSLTASSNPANAGSSVTLSATFSSTSATAPPPGGPTGTVTFTNDATTIGTGKLILNTPGSFSQEPATILSYAPVNGLRMADLNADGIPDAIFFDYNAHLHVALGNTPFGAFQTEMVSTPDANCSYLSSFAIGDVNRDGYPDLVLDCTSTGGSIIVDVLLGNGDGTFAAPVTVGNVFGRQIALADINHDGYLDLIVGGALSTVCTGACPSGFAVFLGNGTSTYTTTFTETTNGNPGTQLLVVDLNNDKYPDIIELNSGAMFTNSIDIYQNNGGTSFGTLSSGVYSPTTSVALLSYPNEYSNLITADFNGDGLPDLGVILAGFGYGITTVLNTSTSTSVSFAAPQTLTLSSYPSALSAGAFTGDGFADLAVITYNGVTVYNSHGDGTFGTAYSGLSLQGTNIVAGAAADLNSDGNADIVVMNSTVINAASVYPITGYLTTGSSTATLTTSFTPAGTESLSATWPGNFEFSGASALLSLQVNGTSTSTSLATSGTPTQYGQPVTFSSVIGYVNSATPTGSISFFDGMTLLATVPLSGGSASFTTSALTAGTHSITAVYSGDSVFSGSSSAILAQLVAQAQPVITWPPPANIYTTQALSSTQLDATVASQYVSSIPGTFIYSPAAGAMLTAGLHTLTVTFTPTDTVDFKSATGSTSIVVSVPPAPAITWPAPAPIVYGTALTGAQLDATTTVPGTFAYTPAAGTVLSAGANQMLRVVFTPTDQIDYSTATGSTTITVNKATPNVSWMAPASIYTTQALSSTQLDATATGTSGTLAGSFVYTPAAGTLLAAGTQTLSVLFTPTDLVDYNTATGSTSITVTVPPAPAITWPSPAPIVYGTALTAIQLDATATVPGTFAYTPAAGTVLLAGANQTLSVTFTPTDQVHYSIATGSTTITVNKATPTVSWTAPAAIVAGTPLSSSQLDATATGISGTLAGSFVYTPAAGTILAAGTQTLSVLFTPTDLVDYNTATATTTIGVLTPTIIAVSPATANLGDSSKTVTVTGIGFVSNTVLQVNGTAVATTFVNGTSLTAIVPASYFQAIQTLALTVYDPTQSQTSAPVSFAVVAVPVQATFTGPSTAQPAQQPNLTFALTNPYPVALSGTLTLTFTGTGGVNDPNIQFAAGGRTYTFTVPANSTTTPTLQIQSGTVAGTITITLVLTAGGQNVTPASVQPLIITVPPVAPVVTSSTLTRSGNAVTVNIIGYSNTREVQQAVFQFVPSAGSSLNDPNITVPVATLFAGWYSTAASQTYGSSFLYTQTFNLSESDSTIGSIIVTLINTAGTSITVTVQ